MSNRISGANEVHINYLTDTSEYSPTYNTLTIISDVAFDTKSTVSISFDLGGLVATNAVSGTSDKLGSSEYSTDIGFTLNNTGSFRVSSTGAKSVDGSATQLALSTALTSSMGVKISLDIDEEVVLSEYDSVLVVDPVSDA